MTDTNMSSSATSTTTSPGPPPAADQSPGTTPTKTIKAWTYTKGGLPRDCLHLTTHHPYPEFPPPSQQSPGAGNKSPKEQEKWLLVKVTYAALNPGEVLLMNLLPPLMSLTFSKSAGVPQVPGYDLTGTVLDSSPSSEEADPSSSRAGDDDEGARSNKFKKGCKVVAFLPVGFILSSKSGALQEVISFPAKYAVLLPDKVASSPPSGTTSRSSANTQGGIDKLAAGLFLAGCTALTQIRDAALQPGHKVLVYGASGGIGSMAVQLAREAVGPEGKVVGVCSTRNLKPVFELGCCDFVMDYTNPATIFTGGEVEQNNPTAGNNDHQGGEKAKETIEQALAGMYDGAEEDQFDAIIDCYGSQRLYNFSAGYLKPSGVYSACGIHANGYGYAPILASGWKLMINAIWPRTKWLGGTGRTWKAASMFDPGREMMEYLVGLFSEGKLSVLVDSEWAFEDVLSGYEVLLSGRARGKIVIRVGGG
ncbi:Reticulon-4-interacting protein 1-like [Rhypophila decipiens]